MNFDGNGTPNLPTKCQMICDCYRRCRKKKTLNNVIIINMQFDDNLRQGFMPSTMDIKLS